MKNAKILIVEDEVIIALELKSVLENLGYEVTAIVDNGEKAIRKTEEASPDIILMDIRIKGTMDGIETAEIIRNRFQIPVVFSTAYLDDERIERAKITMPFGYVLKPIQERDLRVTIEMALFTAQFDRERKETEQALRESEEKYRTLFEMESDALALIDAETGQLLEVNQTFVEMYGYSKEEALSMTNTQVSAEPEETRKATVHESNIIPIRWHKKKDGTIFPTEIVARFFEYKGRKVHIAAIRDITERLKTAEQLDRWQQEMDLTLNATTDGIWKWNFISNELFFSDTYYTMLGYKPNAFEPTFENWIGLIHPDDREQALARASKYLETKPDEYDNEFRLVTANGDYRWIRAKARVVERDQDGNAIRMIGNHEDITETKWATQKLEESEKRLIQAQKLAKIGHWDWFMDTGELRWSDEVYTIFGRSKEDFQVDVASFEAAMHPDDYPAFIEEREKALAENRDVRIEHRIIRPDGSIRWVREIAEILRDEKGNVSRVMGVVQDITQ